MIVMGILDKTEERHVACVACTYRQYIVGLIPRLYFQHHNSKGHSNLCKNWCYHNSNEGHASCEKWYLSLEEYVGYIYIYIYA